MPRRNRRADAATMTRTLPALSPAAARQLVQDHAASARYLPAPMSPTHRPGWFMACKCGHQLPAASSLQGAQEHHDAHMAAIITGARRRLAEIVGR